MNTEHRNFAEQARPYNWLRVADDLHDQAVFLFENGDGFSTLRRSDRSNHTWRSCNRSVFLLAGFALENMLKGYLVYENPNWVSNGTLSGKLTRHGLVELEGLCEGVPFKGQRRRILAALEGGLQSWARYPCAIKAQDWRHPPKLSAKLWKKYLRLIGHYGDGLQGLLCKGWTGPHDVRGSCSFDRPFLGSASDRALRFLRADQVARLEIKAKALNAM